MLASRFAVLLAFLTVSLACSGALNSTMEDESCGCSLELRFGYAEVDDGDDGLQLMARHLAGEQYISLESWQKAERSQPVSTLTALDAFTADERWYGPDGMPSPIEALTIDGWPALSRRTWSTLEHGTVLTHWYALVDLPDRHVYVHVWSEADQAGLFEEAIRIAKGVTLTPPPRGQRWSSFSGVTPAAQMQAPPSIARAEARPNLRALDTEPDPPSPPPDGLEALTIVGPAGPLVAWQTPAPASGKHPVLLVPATHSIADYTKAGDELDLHPYIDAGIPVFLATTRGQHGNPGRPERFWGEVDDLLAAREHLAAQPWVDPQRIILHGSYEAGTLAMLAAAESTGFQKVIVMASPVDLAELHERYPAGYDPTEYEPSPDGHRMRSPLVFAEQLQSPVLYLWGERTFPTAGPFRMHRAAVQSGAPFELFVASEARTADLHAGSAHLLAARVTGGSIDRPLTAEESLELELAILSEAERRVHGEIVDWLDQRLRRGFDDRVDLRAATIDRAESWLGARGPALGAEIFDRRIAAWDEEVLSWTQPTDNARLAKAFARLQEQGVFVEQHYEDCSDCAWAAMKHQIVDRSERGEHATGYVFYSEPATQRVVDGEPLWLNFGDYYGDETVALGERIVEVLEEEGLSTKWSGEASQRIGVEMQWRRVLARP